MYFYVNNSAIEIVQQFVVIIDESTDVFFKQPY
jgi:hypothetical protein